MAVPEKTPHASQAAPSTMNRQDYIKNVCLENKLGHTISCFLACGEKEYYADRHVNSPPAALTADAACAAGLALLENWTADAAAAAIRIPELFMTAPVLVIDDDWLLERKGAPCPHVVLSMFKTYPDFKFGAQPMTGHPVVPDSSPFREILSGLSGQTIITRVEPNRHISDFGAWLIQIKTSLVQTSRVRTQSDIIRH